MLQCMDVLPLSGAAEARADLVGGKAHSLMILVDAGFSVPPGFIVSTEAFRAFLEYNGLDEELRSVEATLLSLGLSESVATKCDQLRKRATLGAWPRYLVGSIGNRLDNLGAPSLAVRSSAVLEDRRDASSAGMLDTALSVPANLERVLEAISRCWASLLNRRGIAYRMNMSLEPVCDVAAVVQRMIPAEVSGTLFTKHPDRLRSETMVIEATYGLGETVVRGLITPDRFLIARESGGVLETRLGRKHLQIRAGPEGPIEEPLPCGRQERLCLGHETLAQLWDLGLRVERLFGSPQDIEWSIDQRRIWVLQSRPLTCFAGG